MKSTSIHSLNADRGLSKLKKIAYLFLNWVNNLFPYSNVDSRIDFKKFSPKNLDNHWDKTYPTSSAARKLSDIFWRSLPWAEFKSELGSLHLFDTGCGHGNYSTRIADGSGWIIDSYTGIDAKRRENWQEIEAKFPNFKFVESRSNDILPLIPPETNVFISQSAIEHFDEDLRFFEQVKEFIDKSNKPAMQIHLFPAGATLPLYLFHGLRQYTPRTISKITKLFRDAKEISLYGLGGKNSFWLHFKYFTWPVLITRKYIKPTFDELEYEPKLKEAVKKDLSTNIRSPLFWALIIKSK